MVNLLRFKKESADGDGSGWNAYSRYSKAIPGVFIDGAESAAPSASVGDKPISGATVEDLGRDGMLTLSVLHGSAYARLTARGSWFARTVVTELAERAVP